MSESRTMQDWLDAYGASHQNPLNKKIHWICVPLIFISIVGLLWSIPLPETFSDKPWLNMATIMLVPVMIFYGRLSVPLTIGMTVWCLACFVMCIAYESVMRIPMWHSSLVVFLFAWLGQFYGHKIEGVKPSFFEDIQFLMIGPAWLMSFIYQRLGIRY